MASGAPPPPPPPPPPPGFFVDQIKQEAAKSSGNNPAGPSLADMLNSQLNKGLTITATLKPVPTEGKKKSTGAVMDMPAATTATGTVSAGGAAKLKGPARFELEAGRKWVVENQDQNREIVITETSSMQTVYIYNCTNSLVQVSGKVSTISLDKCKKTGIIFNDVIAQVEVVNSSSVQVQCKGNVPMVSIDKSDGVQVYVPKALSTAADSNFQVVTAKSSEVNVTVMAEGEEESVEHPVPEQFISCFKGGKLVTEAVSHTGV